MKTIVYRGVEIKEEGKYIFTSMEIIAGKVQVFKTSFMNERFYSAAMKRAETFIDNGFKMRDRLAKTKK